ncbi:MAG TPA: hypothetical protein PLX89_12475 [Verrucomicrobiota bacterium]|nr:hypothetical protein [Verrucomicrobiales bacterium]HRI13808.1 hypothetical protein [Verrucomicrobiota bacterium]
MNHPAPETLVAYVYGELPLSSVQDVEAHVRVCATCKHDVEKLRSTLAALDQDKASLSLPRRRSAAVAWAPVVRWALAASVVLCAGFLIGRWSGTSRADLQREIAATRQELRHQFQEEIKSAAVATLEASNGENRRLLTDFMREVNAGLAADRRDVLAALDTFDRRRALDTETLRAGLLTLARHTGTGFQQTESQLSLLASYLPAESSPNPSNPSSTEPQP